MSQQVTRSKKQIQETIVLGDQYQPQMVKCPYCLNQTISNVTFKNGYLSYISAFFMLLAVGLLGSLMCVPVVMLVTKQLIHRCAVCGEEIGTDGRIFHTLKLKDKMISCKFGELGCILTRKILMGVVILLLTLALLTYRVKTLPEYALQGYHHHHEHTVLINDTWNDFSQNCTRQKYLLEERTRIYCQRHYTDRTIKGWEGYVIRIEDYRSSIMKYLHHAVTILVRMDPPESEFYPDIILTMDSEYVEKLGSVIESLNRGSKFGFSAIIKNLGDQQSTKHFHLVDAWKVEGYKEIPPHLHDHGRYGGPGSGFLNPGG